MFRILLNKDATFLANFIFSNYISIIIWTISNGFQVECFVKMRIIIFILLYLANSISVAQFQ